MFGCHLYEQKLLANFRVVSFFRILTLLMLSHFTKGSSLLHLSVNVFVLSGEK
jgi:hypothetical protein